MTLSTGSTLGAREPFRTHTGVDAGQHFSTTSLENGQVIWSELPDTQRTASSLWSTVFHNFYTCLVLACLCLGVPVCEEQWVVHSFLHWQNLLPIPYYITFSMPNQMWSNQTKFGRVDDDRIDWKIISKYKLAPSSLAKSHSPLALFEQQIAILVVAY